MNPIQLEILWSRLISAVDEAAATLIRTSFSPVVRDSLDFGCVLLDMTGRLVAQSTLSNPSFVGTLRYTVRHLLDRYPVGTLEPGDAYITNDPWIASGHLPDVTILTPVFHLGKLVAFAACGAHQADIGGRIRSADVRELYEEGLRIPFLRFCHRGVLNRDLMDVISANVRVPELVRGDLIAQVAANESCARRLIEILAELDMGDPALMFDGIIDGTRRAVLQSIAAIPPGEYHYEVMNDGVDGVEVRIVARVVTRAGGITVDYAGSSPQVDRAINVVLNYTYAYTVFPLKALLAPSLPNNEGVFNCIHVDAPEGCILNARFPCAVGARTLVGQMLSAALFGALSEAVPDRAPAPGGAPVWGVSFSGSDAERARSVAMTFFLSTGLGASAHAAGRAATNFPANVSATPVEVIEQAVPVHVLSRGIARGTGGDGRNRGGDGQRMVIRLLQDLNASFLADRLRHAAPGLHGGRSGECGLMLIDDQPIDPKKMRRLRAGEVLEIRTPGGGGFGEPGSVTA